MTPGLGPSPHSHGRESQNRRSKRLVRLRGHPAAGRQGWWGGGRTRPGPRRRLCFGAYSAGTFVPQRGPYNEDWAHRPSLSRSGGSRGAARRGPEGQKPARPAEASGEGDCAADEEGMISNTLVSFSKRWAVVYLMAYRVVFVRILIKIELNIKTMLRKGPVLPLTVREVGFITEQRKGGENQLYSLLACF